MDDSCPPPVGARKRAGIVLGLGVECDGFHFARDDACVHFALDDRGGAAKDAVGDERVHGFGDLCARQFWLWGRDADGDDGVVFVAKAQFECLLLHKGSSFLQGS